MTGMGWYFFFATANLYLSVIKMLSAKEIPCSFSQTWGHPFSLWCYGGLCGVLYSEPDPSQLGTVSKYFLRQPEVLLVPTESETRGNDSGDEFCEGAQPGHGWAGSKRCRIPCFKDQAAYFKLWDLMAFLLSIGLTSDTSSIRKVYPTFAEGQGDLTIK